MDVTSPTLPSPSILPIPTTPSTHVHNIVNLISVKLDRTNYLLSKSMFLAIFRTRDLIGFIDSSQPCPPPTTVIDKVTLPNPDHSVWIKHDQHIVSWIMVTLSESILGQVVTPHYIVAHSLV